MDSGRGGYLLPIPGRQHMGDDRVGVTVAHPMLTLQD